MLFEFFFDEFKVVLPKDLFDKRVGIISLCHSLGDLFKVVNAGKSVGKVGAVKITAETECVFRTELEKAFNVAHNVVNGTFIEDQLVFVGKIRLWCA